MCARLFAPGEPCWEAAEGAFSLVGNVPRAVLGHFAASHSCGFVLLPSPWHAKEVPQEMSPLSITGI